MDGSTHSVCGRIVCGPFELHPLNITSSASQSPSMPRAYDHTYGSDLQQGSIVKCGGWPS